MIKAADLIAKFRRALDDKWGYIWGTSGEQWTDAKQRQLEQTTDEDRAQGRQYGSKWIGHMVADCSGLFTWAFRQLGGEMYHGSDTMYRKWCTDHGRLNAGKRSDGKQLLPGSAVFCWNGTKYSHVGLYVGDGTVIEAMGTKNGVTTSKASASKWKYWGELKGVEYGEYQSVKPPKDQVYPGEPGEDSGESGWVPAKPTLRKGARGEYVTLMQTRLINLGYDLGSWGADGSFGSATEKAVRQFQQDWGLTVDGIVGPKTWAMLDGTPDRKLYTVTIRELTKSQAEALAAKYPGATVSEKEG